MNPIVWALAGGLVVSGWMTPSASGAGSPFYEIRTIAQRGSPVGTGQQIVPNEGWCFYCGDQIAALLPSEPEINPHVSINDGGIVAFSALVNQQPGLEPFPQFKVVGFKPLDDALYAASDSLFSNPSVSVLNNGSIYPGRCNISDLVDLGNGQHALTAGQSSQSENGTIAFVGQRVTVGTDSHGQLVIGPPDTNVFLFRGKSGSFTSLGFLAVMANEILSGDVQIADDLSVLVQSVDLATSESKLEYFDTAGGRHKLHTTTDGWQSLSDRPGFSRDGKVVAFVGVNDDGAVGLYVQLLNSPYESLNKARCIIDGNTRIAWDEFGDPIRLEEIDRHSMSPVIHHDVDDDGELVGDTIIVAFAGKPTSASRPNPAVPGVPLLFSGEPGLWTVRIDIERELRDTNAVNFSMTGVLPVVQDGDVIDGVTITNLFLWRGLGRGTAGTNGLPRVSLGNQPSPGDHYIGFWAGTSGGPRVYRAAHLDGDRDGLLDHWEVEGGGIDMDRDGEIDLDLFQFGARVDHKDLFLEVDWTAARSGSALGSWSTEPNPGALDLLAQMFANAPVPNPAGPKGITLHVDAGPGTDFFGQSYSVGMGGASSSFLQGGDLIRTTNGLRPDVVYLGSTPPYTTPHLRYRSFDTAKDDYFGTTDKRARELAFHYAILADFNEARVVADHGGVGQPLQVEIVTDTWFTTVTNLDLSRDGRADIYAQRGDYILMVNGPAAGSGRVISHVTYEDAGALTLEWLGAPFRPAPQPGNEFVILSGSSGQAEVVFRGLDTGDDPDNQHGLPGNDLVISLGAWGPGSLGFLGTIDDHWRTLAHELGHNFGLRHGGNNAFCTHVGDVFWSLMTYSHQFRTGTNALEVGGPNCPTYADPNPDTAEREYIVINPPPPGLAAHSPNPGVVMSFSDGMDPLGFDEWDYVKMDLWRTLPFVGNTRLHYNGILASPDEHSYPTSLDRLGAMIGDPIIQLLAPAPRTPVPLDAPLTVEFSVQHDAEILPPLVTFPLDGTTNAESAETVEAILVDPEANTYSASFDAVTGPPGFRLLRIEASDQLGHVGTFRTMLPIATNTIPDTSVPSTTFTFPSANSRVSLGRPLFVEVNASDSGSGIARVLFRFDANGDGIVSAADEQLTATAAGGTAYQGTFREVSGPAGSRSVQAIVTDLWRNARTNSVTVNVRPLDRQRPQLLIVSPENGSATPLGSIVRVLAIATDNLSIDRVIADFDLDGNGSAERYAATVENGTNYTIDLGTITSRLRGPLGFRSLRVEAIDEASNRVALVRSLQIIDSSPPSIQLLSPTNDSAVALSQPLTVDVSVTDDQAVSGVTVALDLNGDGVLGGAGEVQTASLVSASLYRAVLDPPVGREGPRSLLLSAWDPAGKTAAVSRVVYVTSGAVIKSPVEREIIKPASTFQVRLETVAGVTMTNVLVAFDLNGDGLTTGPGETVAALPLTQARRYAVAFANVQGPPGPRQIVVQAFDSSGGTNRTQREIQVAAFGGYASSLSTKEAAVPLLPERTPGDFPAGSGPIPLASTPQHLFFTAIDPGAGWELYRTDGTPGGTQLLRDINPDWAVSFGTLAPLGSSIDEAAELNGAILFAPSDWHGSSFGPLYPHVGTELWRSDGTTAGTVLCKDIRPGGESSSPQFLTRFQGRVLFAANDGTHGNELWISDGTSAGTTIFADLTPGGATSHSNPRQLTVAGSTLYFEANGRELWRTDGTVAGTARVKDLRPGTTVNLGGLAQLTPCGGLLYFTVNDATNGWELWRSDGTGAGTIILGDLTPGPGGAGPRELTAVGSRLYFVTTNAVVGTELWQTEGTPETTRVVVDLVVGPFSAAPRELTAFRGQLFFSGLDAVNGEELWTTDGTPEGTVLVANIATASTDFPAAPYPRRSSSPRSLTEFNGALYFSADDGAGLAGRELWKTDGTPSGTTLVKDLAPGDGVSSSPQSFRVWNGALYFTAADGYASELWRSDGTEAGTLRLRNINSASAPPVAPLASALILPASDGLHGMEPWRHTSEGVAPLADLVPGGHGSNPTNLTRFLDQLLFTGVNPANTNQIALFSTDGTPSGSRLVRAFAAAGSPLFPITPLGSVALFSASDGNASGRELWRTDGTPTNTALVREIRPGAGESLPVYAAVLGPTAFFTANDGTNGVELWRTDGTHTELVTNINSGSLSANPRFLTPHAGRLIFAATSTELGEELWSTDGTPGGTVLLTNIAPANGSSVVPSSEVPGRLFTLFQGDLYFAANNGSIGAELWKTDGTTAGTRLVKDIYPGNASAAGRPDGLTVAGSRLFFSASSAVNSEPWTSDGTSAGTVLIKNIAKRLPSGIEAASNPSRFIAASGIIFFLAEHESSGRELWRSDGTVVGTVLVRDIFPGLRSSQPSLLVAIGESLYFVADDGEHGRELWTSDGTYEGTRMVEDLIPGPGSANPTGLTNVLGALVYFAADGGDDLSLRRVAAPGPSPFRQWIQSAPALTGDNGLAGADPDGDGLSNIVEYDLNTDPARADGGPLLLPPLVVHDGTTTYTDVRYVRRRNVAARGLNFFIERGAALSGLSAGSAVFPQTVTPLNEEFEEVSIRVPRPRVENQNYFRLRVTSLP